MIKRPKRPEEIVPELCCKHNVHASYKHKTKAYTTKTSPKANKLNCILLIDWIRVCFENVL